MWRENRKKKEKKTLKHEVILEVKRRRLAHPLRIILDVMKIVDVADTRTSLANGHFSKAIKNIVPRKRFREYLHHHKKDSTEDYFTVDT